MYIQTRINKMKDIFDAKILCRSCNTEMRPTHVVKSGFKLRAMACPKCGERIIHPTDLHTYNHYSSLRRKTYKVKLRIIGNSHAISIPKEIVEFINQLNSTNKMNEMVKLCFEDFGKLGVYFVEEERWQK
ncbi:hypothetical protein D6817_03390 [Candidatus Pacearchaeota archaeon]|nr:MAG: hypothetical protein D6817_03390 [Candidatus Pacearchaeota archaeon]